DAKDPRHDVAVVINGEKIYVDRGILATHSPVFNEIFFGEFVDQNKKEFEVNDVDREKFIDVLHMIYPSDKKISDDSAEQVLHLADRFKMQMNLSLDSFASRWTMFRK
ncbi:hypothetical protein PMAYCL1PPCAC_24951, partial [Pristionchus mayeri]